MTWREAADVKNELTYICEVLKLHHIDLSRVYCFRTEGSKARAYARTWAFPKIFQRALSVKPAYVIEVIAKYYDRLNQEERTKVLIHELLHIPKNFSGALLPHRIKNRHLGRLANSLFKEFKKRRMTI